MLLHRTNLLVIATVLILSLPVVAFLFGFISEEKSHSFDSVDLDEGCVHTNRETPVRNGPDHQWPMLGRDMYHSHFQPLSSRGIGDVKVKWDNQQDVLSWATLVGDFSANIYGPAPEGRQHVLYTTSTELHIVDGSTGDDMWVLDIENLNISMVGDVAGAAPAIADFDKNGKVEVVFVTDNNLQNEGILYVFEPNITYNATGYHWDAENNGVSERKFAYPHEGNTIESSPVLGDINNDGREDAVLTMGMNIIALDIYNQQVIYVYDKLVGNKASAPVLFRYSPNDLRCVINTRDGSQLNTYMVDHNGDTAWNRSIPISSVTTNGLVTFLPSPAIGEISMIQDGSEIVILTPFEEGDGRVRVYTKDGDELWSVPFQADGQFDSSPVLMNTDGDLMKEIGVVSWKAILLPEPHIESHAYLLDNNGDVLWSFVKNESASIEGTVASPVAGLVNHDDVPDMVLATTNTVIALDGTDGKRLWDIAPASGVMSSSPAVGEFDNDDFLDIALEGFVLSNREVDLTLNSSDITFTDTTIYDGVEVGIVAMIRNLGEDEAKDVDVRFYETVSEDVRLIGNATIDSIPAGDTRQSTMDWTPLEKGDTEITISIDFNNTIPETNEDNNRRSTMINVRESMADLEIVNVDLKRHDGVKTDNENTHLVDGEESYINITITNSGLKDAPTCNLLMKMGSSVLIDRNDLGSVAPGELVYREIPHRFSEGISELNISLDPDDVVREENSTNNYYEASLTVIDDDPDDASYIIEGHVYTSDVTIASGAEIRAFNNETVEQMIVFSDSNGAYSLDVSDIRGGYHEGDEIKIFASHGNESYVSSIFVYSEDKGIVKNIILKPGDSHDFDMRFVGANDIAGPPGISHSFRFTVTNRGDGENEIEFEDTALMDENTSLALDWDAVLSTKSIEFSSNGESRDVTLTVTVPPETDLGTKARFTVTGYSKEERNLKRNLTGSITIAADAAFNLSADTVAISLSVSDEETEVYFHYDVENTGSVEDSYGVGITVYPDELDVVYSANFTLKAQETKTLNVTVEVPANTEPDTYLIQVDVTSDSTGSTKNMVFAVQVGSPELSIDADDISITPSTPQLGDEITISCRITNNGTFDSGAFSVKMTEEGNLVASQQKTAASIAKNLFGIVVFKANLTEYGLYRFQIQIDPDGEFTKDNLDDNTAEKSLDLRPDLLIDNARITISAISGGNLTDVVKGDTVYLKIEISNPGDVDLDMAFTVTAYSSADKGAAVFGTLFVDEVIPGGDSTTVTMRAVLANADIGEQAIVVKLDTDDNITEMNEDNNMVRLTVTVAEAKVSADRFSSMEKGLAFIGIFAVFVIIAVLVKRKRSGKHSEYYDDEEDDEGADEVRVVPVEDDDDSMIVEPMAVEAVEDKEGGKKKKRSLQELLSKLEKTTDHREKKPKKTEEPSADEDLEMDISDIIEMAKETDLDKEISDMLDMDVSGEGTDEEEEDFIGKLRGEMGGMMM